MTTNYDQRQPMPQEDSTPDVVAAESPISSIPVHMPGPVATTDSVTQGSYATLYIPASTATSVAVEKILPADPTRQYAYVLALTETVILATSRGEAQSIANLAAQLPTGASSPSGTWSPPIRHKEAIWAANTSTSSPALVSVIVERGD
jgi:hypothetical protein